MARLIVQSEAIRVSWCNRIYFSYGAANSRQTGKQPMFCKNRMLFDY